MKKIEMTLSLAGIAFGIALAGLIVARLSEQALSVVAGVACGVGALLPALIVLSVMALRRRDEARFEPPHYPRQAYPPVIVLAPPAQPALPAGGPYGQTAYPPPVAARQFSIIGSEGERIVDEYQG
ncbi:MAG: hypothetical protein JW850_19050 [Thermoflexales bacterium]|nr:hypothetical protein [Thermoflexales bacterium]